MDVENICEIVIYVAVRSPAASVESLGQNFSTDLQYVVSLSFYDEVLGTELWNEFSARGQYFCCGVVVKFVQILGIGRPSR